MTDTLQPPKAKAAGAQYSSDIIEDLRKSGLVPSDVLAKPLGPSEKAAVGAPMGVSGYVFPYFDLNGKPIQFYRAKLFNSTVKYKQLADSKNHIYFPPKLHRLLPTAQYIILTEGEKKAAACVAHGFPAVAVSGVDSWRTRTVVLPKDVSLAQRGDGKMSAKLPPGASTSDQYDHLAEGLAELINLVIKRNIPIIICYDNDQANEDGQGLNKFEVQRAAATLGFELRFRGIPLRNIRHLVLDTREHGKVGLDDYLAAEEDGFGPGALGHAIDEVLAKKSAFPRHPNPRGYINRRLTRHSMPRQEMASIAMAVLSDLDARGRRLRAPDEDALYYFKDSTKTLTRVRFSQKPEFAETKFGIQLYNDYGLAWTDQKVLGWVMSQFAAEDPIEDVFPEKVLTWRGDSLYYHLSDGRMIRVTHKDAQILDNGEDGVLFEAGMVEPIDEQKFIQAFRALQANPIENWWRDVLTEARIKADGVEDRHRRLLSLLYYTSPWFYRWRGTQLPVEITVGEAGSGKSTMYQLRLDIITGMPKLRNSPTDIRDWNAGLATTGAMHVTDNVQLANVELRQRLSDEICRLVTEPKPSVEQRKLYTDVGIVKIPVRCVFAITAIKQPFTNVDIIQRAIITELDKGTSSVLTYDADWEQHQLEKFGGREHWLAHQLLVVQRILQLVHANWENRYKAKYRLINVEQLLIMADQVFGATREESLEWLPQHLEQTRDQKAAEGDWALEGLVAYGDYLREANPPEVHAEIRFQLSNVSEWIADQDEFRDCKMLTNSRALGRYWPPMKHVIATVAGLIPAELVHNKQLYRLRTPEDG